MKMGNLSPINPINFDIPSTNASFEELKAYGTLSL